MKDKCHQYWPDNDETAYHGSLTVKNVDEVELSDHVVRTFEVINEEVPLSTKYHKMLVASAYIHHFRL